MKALCSVIQTHLIKMAGAIHLLKYKFFNEAELRIIVLIKVEGRLAGILDTLEIEGIVNRLCVRSCVGTGLMDEDRKILCQDAKLISKIITVKYRHSPRSQIKKDSTAPDCQ